MVLKLELIWLSVSGRDVNHDKKGRDSSVCGLVDITAWPMLLEPFYRAGGECLTPSNRY